MQVRGPAGQAHNYWVPVKADLKSLVWHSAMTPAEVQQHAARPADWCLGMAAAATSGWPGTDWVEDIILQGPDGPQVYDKLATGRLPWDSPEVRRAFATWKALVGAGDKTLATRALETDFALAAGTRKAGRAACSLEHLPAFARLDEGWQGHSPEYEPSARVIPGARADSDTWEVSGDLAALFRSTPPADRFMRYLTGSTAQENWLGGHQAGLSADTAVAASAYRVPDPAKPASAYGPDPAARQLAALLHKPGAQYCWDASDALPPLVRDAFTDAVLRFLAKPQDLTAQLETVQAANRLAHEQIDEGGRTVAFLAKACVPG
jgi:alpha-glucoside transport system substrate-binding protein